MRTATTELAQEITVGDSAKRPVALKHLLMDAAA